MVRKWVLSLAAWMTVPLILGACGTHRPAPAPIASPQFTDVTRAAGIEFKHNSGARGRKYMPETVGSGCAFLDFDRDGWQDILLVNSRDWPGVSGEAGLPALYRNLGNGTFEDVTRKAGIAVSTYGMGAAVADYDGDGWDDLYLTNLGANILYHNERNGSFRDVTRSAGASGCSAAGPDKVCWKWSSSAAWLDYDRDGRLDLFVCNYVRWSPERDLWCGVRGQKGYCPPDRYEPQPCLLYRNVGNGRFQDVSRETGIDAHPGKAFGVAVADYNEDGWPDIAVANDTFPNFLFRNESGKRFVEDSVVAGIAVGEKGNPRAGMGIDAADWDNTGRPGLVIGNFSTEGLALYRGEGDGVFTDVSHSTGLAGPSLLFLTFGLFFFDFDLDGFKDVFAGNGHIDDLVNRRDSRITYEERPLLYRNIDGRSFQETAESCGAPLRERRVVRGCAWGDFDNDGDPDILGNCSNGAAFLWRNDVPARKWLRVVLEGKESNRSGIGAVVRLSAGSLRQTALVRSGGSFLSESDRRPLFGLGPHRHADSLEIHWPSGRMERVKGPLQAGHTYRVREGQGLR